MNACGAPLWNKIKAVDVITLGILFFFFFFSDEDHHVGRVGWDVHWLLGDSSTLLVAWITRQKIFSLKCGWSIAAVSLDCHPHTWTSIHSAGPGSAPSTLRSPQLFHIMKSFGGGGADLLEHWLHNERQEPPAFHISSYTTSSITSAVEKPEYDRVANCAANEHIHST